LFRSAIDAQPQTGGCSGEDQRSLEAELADALRSCNRELRLKTEIKHEDCCPLLTKLDRINGSNGTKHVSNRRQPGHKSIRVEEYRRRQSSCPRQRDCGVKLLLAAATFPLRRWSSGHPRPLLHSCDRTCLFCRCTATRQSFLGFRCFSKRLNTCYRSERTRHSRVVLSIYLLTHYGEITRRAL
jgi:hypothetical protein